MTLDIGGGGGGDSLLGLNHINILSLTLKLPRTSRFSLKGVAAANFARGSEPHLKRKVLTTNVYAEEGTKVPSLNTRGLACTR